MTDPVLDKRQFFWDHLNLDLKITCKTLNVNKDEILLLLHTVCTDILKSHNSKMLKPFELTTLGFVFDVILT